MGRDDTASLAMGAPASEAVCLALLQALSIPAFVHRGDRIVLANDALCRLLGGEASRLLDTVYSDIAAPEMRDQMSLHGAACLVTDPQPAATEMVLRTASGDDRYVELTAHRIDLEGLPAVLSTCQDLTDTRHVQTSLLTASQELMRHRTQLETLVEERTAELRRMHEELETNYERMKETNHRLEEAQNQLLQSEKMASIGQLAAGVAHEINNPIGFVSSNLGSLGHYVEGMLRLMEGLHEEMMPVDTFARERIDALKAEVDFEYMREDLPVLLRESADGLQRVKRIVQDLKDFSRVDNSDWAEADINAGLDSTLNVVYNEVKYKAEVRKAYGALPPVRCLLAQLNQVFMNLIVNAAHAIESQGVITLSTGHAGAWVWVEVADTGCGMAPDVQRRVFEPFFTTKPVGKGTGLGLSLSFSIVQKHKGSIKLQSEVGRGSAFRIWLPVNPEDPDVSAPAMAG